MKKKLTFRVETLRQLSSDELQRANGGTIQILTIDIITLEACSFLGITSCGGGCSIILIGPTGLASRSGDPRPQNCMAALDSIEGDAPISIG